MSMSMTSMLCAGFAEPEVKRQEGADSYQARPAANMSGFFRSVAETAC